ncbi:hypothetical protein DPMN_121000 [Dreissena polymorpha]|uniref:Uncharacterized protein n=1 Tax=Dreissena polymorpha TaxID=45954 RepID=A0A9D4GPQ2_DREPO|nr:hypothetical protein DPMN_121000 [Dreissena polymorpha]
MWLFHGHRSSEEEVQETLLTMEGSRCYIEETLRILVQGATAELCFCGESQQNAGIGSCLLGLCKIAV